MAEMTKQLHFLKNGTEQTAKAYSTVDEVGEQYVSTKIDGINCYVPLTTKKYYKKVAWVQPVLTSNTSHGTLTTNSTSTNAEHSAWKAFDGNSDTWFETGASQKSAYLNWNFGDKFYVTGITVKSRTGDRPNLTIRAYTDETMGTPIGDALSFTTAGQTQTVANIPADGMLIDNIYFDCTSTQNYLGVCEITITGYVITESTKDDYDVEEWVDATNGRIIKTFYVKKVIVDEIWQQPVLSANGTMGGSEFACSVSAYGLETAGSVADAYGAFDNDTNTYWRSGTTSGWIQFYNPVPLKVSAIKWGYFYCYPTGGDVQCSNDGETWTTLTTWTNSSAADFTISLNHQEYYKYYRINVTGVNKDVIHAHSLTITATYQKETETYVGKDDDYDYSFTDTYAIKSESKPPYAKIEYTTPGTYSFTVPSGVTTVKLTVAGGGGSSGECTRDSIPRDDGPGLDIHYHAGAGGQGGLYTGLVTVTPNTTYDIVVGAGGEAAKKQHSGNGAVGNGGNPGGTSSFGSLASATGGGGGGGGNSGKGNGAAGTPVGAGGAGGAKCTVSDSSWSYGHSVAGKPGWVYVEYGGDI